MEGVKPCKKRNKKKFTSNPLLSNTVQVNSLKFQKPKEFTPNENPIEQISLTEALSDVCYWSDMKDIHKDVMDRSMQIEKLKKEEMKRRNLEKRNPIYTNTISTDDLDKFLLCLPVKVGAKTFKAIYDTGSETSLMDNYVYKQLIDMECIMDKSETKMSEVETICLCGDSKPTVLGSCEILVEVTTECGINIPLSIRFLIVDILPNYPMILGLDAIVRHKIEGKLFQQKISISGKDISLQSEANTSIENTEGTKTLYAVWKVPLEETIADKHCNNILFLNLNTDLEKDNLLVLNVGLGNFWTFCLYDTGCQISLVSLNFLANSGVEVTDFSKSKISLISINGRSENNVLGKCKLFMKTITDDERIIEFPIKCLIVKDLKAFPAIFGLNTIVDNKLESQLHKKTIQLNYHTISLIEYPGTTYQPIFAKSAKRIPPRSKEYISCISTAISYTNHIDYRESTYLKNKQMNINYILPNRIIEVENISDTEIYISPQRILGFIANLGNNDTEVYGMHIKMKDEFDQIKIHKDTDFEDNMEARLPEIQSDIEQWSLDDIKISGTEEQQKMIRKLCKEYQHLFARSKLDVGLTKLMTHKIQIDRSIPIRGTKQIHHHGPALEYAKKCLNMWLQMGIIEKAHKPIIVSNLLLIPKTEAGSKDFLDRSKAGKLSQTGKNTSTWRPVVDLRQTNSLSRNVELPNAILPDSIICKLRNKITSNFDLVNAFFNIPLEKQSRRYCCFYFEKEKYQFARLTQGLSSSPGALSKLLSLMFNDQVYHHAYNELTTQEQSIISSKYSHYEDFILYYFDDIWLSTSGDIVEHLVCLKMLFKALEHGGVLLSPKKCILFSPEVNVLGLTVQTMTGNILLDYKRGMSFVTMARPNSLYELSSRLSSMNYFRQFLPKLKEITTIFYTMLKERKWRWTPKEEKSWMRLKAIILLDVKLTIPAPEEQLLITCDASNLASSQCLWVHRDNKLYLVSTNSKLFNSGQLNKPIHTKETMSLVYALKQFYPYLVKTKKKVIIFTDARNLLVLNRQREHSIMASGMSGYIQRMCILLKFAIYSIPSQINWMADLCSRSMTSSRYIDIKQSKYTISKEYLEYLPKLEHNINISEDILLKLFNNEVEPLKEDTGRRVKTRTKSLTDAFQLYLDSTPEEAMLSAILFLREISRDLCNIKLKDIGIDLGELEITLKDDYAQRQLLKKNDRPEEKSKFRTLINSIITKTIDDNFGKNFRPGERTRLKNCLIENFQKMIEGTNHAEEERDSTESLERVEKYINQQQISCGTILAKEENDESFLLVESENEGSLAELDEEDAGYDFVLNENIEFKPYERKLVNSGVKINIPRYHCGILYLRSSAFGILNICHGVIDQGYKGNIKFVLENATNRELILQKGGRYVQIVIHKILKPKISEGKVKADSVRGTNGFGSSNVYNILKDEEEIEQQETEWFARIQLLVQDIQSNLDNEKLDIQRINELFREANRVTDDNPYEEIDYGNIEMSDDEFEYEEDTLYKFNHDESDEENIYQEIENLPLDYADYHENNPPEMDMSDLHTPKHFQATPRNISDKPIIFKSDNTSQSTPKEDKPIGKQVTFNDNTLIKEIESNQDQLEKQTKGTFLDKLSKIKDKFMETATAQPSSTEEETNQFQRDSFTTYRERESSNSDQDYEDIELHNYSLEEKQPEIQTSTKFIKTIYQCYTTLTSGTHEEIQGEDIPTIKQAIQAAKLSITFLEKDMIDKADFITLQRKCELFGKIYEDIDRIKTKEKKLNNYQIIEGFLYNIKTGYKLCIPKNIIINTIKCIHEHHAHSSIDQTQKLFNRYYYYPSVIKLIQIYVKNCFTCVFGTWSFDNNRQSDRRTVRAKYPLHIISIDLMPNLPKTPESYTCMMVLMDEFSTNLFIYPLKDRSMSEVLKQLKNFLATIGFPKYIRSDQEAALISALKILSSTYAIIPIYSNAYKHHQNNVEAGICFLKKTMNKIIYDVEDPQPKTNWYEVGIKAVNIINNTIPSGCKSTKRELFYNIHNEPPFLSKFTIDDNQDNLDKDLQYRTKDYEEEMEHSQKHNFKIHDLVIIRNHAPTPTGMSSSFNLKMNTDIYIITAVKAGSRTITIKNIDSDKTKEVNSEDVMIIPIENYFFKSKKLPFDPKLDKEVKEKTDSITNIQDTDKFVEVKSTEKDNSKKNLESIETDSQESIFNQKFTKELDPAKEENSKGQNMKPTEEKEGPIANRLRSRKGSL